MAVIFQTEMSSGSGGTPHPPPKCPKGKNVCCDKSKLSDASSQPVRYQNGEIQMAVIDLSSEGFGMPWGHTRTYCNQLEVNGAKASFNFGNGFNWTTQKTAYLIDLRGDDSKIAVVISADESYWFTLINGSYNGAFGALQTLVHDEANHVFRFIQTDGSVWLFHDFDQIANPAGMVSSVTNPGDMSSLTFSYPSATNLESEVQRSYIHNSVTTIESYLYAYLPAANPNAGSISSISLRRKVGSDAWQPVERVEFTYYESSSTNGGLLDLQTAVHQLPNGIGGWNNVKTYYYRYYRGSDGGKGFSHGLKFVLEPEAFRLLSAAVADPLTATDTQVSQFANYYFEFDKQQRVTLERVKSGALEYRFAYTASDNLIDYNNWQTKTVETLPDNSRNIVYTNHLGRVLLKEFVNGTDRWMEYNQYDDTTGRVILYATPSAVQGYDDSQADLGGPSVIVKSTIGLVELTSYYASTTATATTPGGVQGYQKNQHIQKGLNGTRIKLSEYTYFKRNSTAGSPSAPLVTIYPLASEIIYPSDTDQSITQVTSYAYTFFTGTCAIQQKTTTFPAVNAAQNGTGVAAVRKEVFDIYGNLAWQMDERGFITNSKYDVVTGAVTQRIDDVNTTIVSGAPSGWSTPAGGGLSLISDFENDNLGRVTQSLGPSHTIDLNGTATAVRRANWNVYQDASYQNWSGQGYATGSPGSYAYTLINPVSITKLNANDSVLEQIQATRASTNGKLVPSDTFAQPSYVRWTTKQYTDCCLAASTRVYHLIPTSGPGASGTNYDETIFGYDSLKRPNRQVAPSGTITRTVYDVRNQTTKLYVGTNDTGATQNDPTGGGASSNNMVQVSGMVYDNGAAGGDGNLTQNTSYVDTTTTRVTTFLYDFRNRRVATDGEVDSYEELKYDNLNRVTRRDKKDTTAAGKLVARSETRFDNRGRVYQTLRYAVNPTTGAVGNSLVDNSWYDPAGNVLCKLPSGSNAFSKTFYDSIGRPTTSYTGYTPSGPIVPTSVTNDVIFEHIASQFDAASNTVFATFRQRWDNATGTGPLNGPTGSQPKSRDSYSANWSDALGRTIATANYGTNNDAGPPVRPATVPASTDSILVSQTRYNDRGEAFESVDASGKINRTISDNAGRTIKTIQNVVSGGGTPGNDQNVTVEQAYTAGHTVSLTAKNPVTGDQVTQYQYGVTLTTSAIASNDLMSVEIYPDAVDATDRVTYTYNRQGQRTTKTDQKGSVHTYTYDKLGRPTADSVTTLASGVDGAVRRIGRSYEVRGMIAKITSFANAAGTGTVVNEVQNLYNDFGQLNTQYQSHSGVVNTMSTPKVAYAYENGSANTVRPTSMTYPNGSVMVHQYDNTDADRLSRVRTLKWNGTDVCRYSYLGASTFVTTDYLQPQVKLNYASGSGVNPYEGFDRFERVIDLPWTNYGTNNSMVHLKYGYDRVSNRTWREDLVAQSNSQNFDELYGYDGIQRLKEFDRGLLNGAHNAINSPTFDQDWQLDATGNWNNFTQNVPANSSQDLNQQRTSNKVNEITNIARTVGANWATPQYDRNGNSTSIPKPNDPTTSFTATWDAWNRLTVIQDGSTTIATYAYDGQNWRTTKTSSGTVRHYYYSSTWQALEERLDTSTSTERQFVWGSRYIDDLILRDRDTNGDDTLDERLYPMQDANWNVTAIANTSGVVQERYSYQAYGTTQDLTPSFTPRSSSSFNWEITYGSYRFDPETALYHIRNRYLNSAVGNWCSRDPIGYEGSKWNVYAYVNGSSITLTDPEGLEGMPPPPKCPPCKLTPRVIPVAGGCAAADGPIIPIGDFIGVGMIVCAIIYDQCTQEVSVQVQPANPPPPRRTTCAKDYKKWVLCDRYLYATKSACGNQVFPGGKIQGPRTATTCGDGGGWHYNVRKRGKPWGSILCCNCCYDTPAGAVTTNRCKGQ